VRAAEFGLRRIRRLLYSSEAPVLLSVLYVAFQRVLRLILLLFRSAELQLSGGLRDRPRIEDGGPVADV